jgi:amino-acid N-acetyltransferase
LADFTLRPAVETDSAAIKDLIHRVGINPMGLDWRRFVVAVDGSGKMRGCGQLKLHGKDIVELASIAVEPEERGKGVARAILEHLIAQAPRPLYLMCRSSLAPFYEKWNFRAVALSEMPPYFRRVVRLASLFMPKGESLLVMRLL